MSLHPRTVIRHAAARAIMDSGAAYAGRVFIARAAKLQGLNDLPCVCVYTNNETTDSSREHGVYTQRVEVEVVVYARRAPDEIQTPPAMNYAVMAQDLDSICGEIETRLQTLFGRGKVEHGGETVCIEDGLDLNTRIDQSEGGEVPYSIATITFFVNYTRDLRAALEVCNFTTVAGFLRPKMCGNMGIEVKL